MRPLNKSYNGFGRAHYYKNLSKTILLGPMYPSLILLILHYDLKKMDPQFLSHCHFPIPHTIWNILSQSTLHLTLSTMHYH
jgi:hypothetical protein